MGNAWVVESSLLLGTLGALGGLIGSGIIPPLMGIWNKEGYLFGIPYFFVGCWCVSALLVLLTLFLYWYERNDKTFDD